MLRLTLAQMRLSLGRLASAGIAIAIGTAFVTATLLAGGVMTRTGYDAVTATFADADLVVAAELGADDVEAVRALPAVTAADPLVVGGAELSSAARTTWQAILPTPSDPRLSALTVSEGAMPASPGQVALPAETLERLGIGVGDEVTVRWTDWSDAETPVDRSTPVRVVGVVSDPAGAWAQFGGAGLAVTEDVLDWSGFGAEGATTSRLLLATDVESAAREQVASLLPEADVMTRDEAAARAIEEISGEGNALVMVVLGFAAVALLVAALVIANTFQVLVAQRTRTLALLRAVGAVKSQLRRSVLVEAGVLGLAASAVGVVLGMGLAQLALSVLSQAQSGVPLPTTVAVTWTVVLVPLLVGTLVTVLASLVPARAATRVSPVAALRPAEAPTVTNRGGRVRLVFSILLVVAGATALGGGVAMAAGTSSLDPILVLGIAVLGGAVSFVGVLLGGVFWLPRVVSLAGRLLSASGPAARLAAANTMRNPRRTAATSAALLIGVTLVALMSTGAMTARASISAELNERYPVDMQVSAPDPSVVLDEDVVATIAGVDGVRDAVAVHGATVQVGPYEATVLGLDPAIAGMLRDPRQVADLDDGTVVVAEGAAWMVPDDVATISGEAGTADLDVLETGLGGQHVIVTPATLEALAGDAPVATVWVAIDDDARAADVAFAVTDAFPDVALQIESAAVERQENDRVIDTLLAIVVGLLGVAVVIALVGVANTLSLSVIERRRESATLRAIGLTRRQLRTTLAVEGVIIAGIGAVLGIVLGLAYGWAGAATVFARMGDLQLAVPWRDLGLVLLVAVVAGLLASVLPARSATRTPPVAALAEE